MRLNKHNDKAGWRIWSMVILAGFLGLTGCGKEDGQGAMAGAPVPEVGVA